MQPSRTQVLRLYKELLRYGDMLVLTDKKYYKERIKTEFYNSRSTKTEEIKFLYEVDPHWSFLKRLFCSYEHVSVRLDPQRRLIEIFTVSESPHRWITIDKSKVPVLDEKDLEEHFIKGGGPGGQKVNKGNNCVYLIHKPTGLSVKVHESREQSQNRKLARQKLTILLDNMINKEDSIENQRKEILNKKSLNKIHKQKKLTELKTKWKQLISEYS